MDKPQLIQYLEKIDSALQTDTTLCIFGAAALILLDEPDRTSLDVDVIASHSDADYGDLERAAAEAGLPINPSEETSSDYIEWILPLRVCLPDPNPETDILLWQGSRLKVKTVALPALIASKLVRYDEIDQGDILYLCSSGSVEYSEIESVVETLPPAFKNDPVVRDNLRDLKVDMEMWRGSEE